jgi:hypothetical protein
MPRVDNHPRQFSLLTLSGAHFTRGSFARVNWCLLTEKGMEISEKPPGPLLSISLFFHLFIFQWKWFQKGGPIVLWTHWFRFISGCEFKRTPMNWVARISRVQCPSVIPASTFSIFIRRARDPYSIVEKKFEEEARDMEVVDSIRDFEMSMDGQALAMEDGAMTGIEMRRMSEIEQSVRLETGLPQRALHPHPDGWKQDGDDGKEDFFGKVYTKVRKEKPTPGGVKYIRTLPLRPVQDDVEEVEVCFAFRGSYIQVKVPSNLTQEEAEQMGGIQFEGNVGLIEFRPPTTDLTYRFKAMHCKNREEAVWTKCDRTDSGDEEWALFGQELSDK